MLTFSQFIAESPEQTIIGLLRLAQRPGSDAEGENAMDKAVKLANKHGLNIDQLKGTASKTDQSGGGMTGDIWQGGDPFARNPAIEKKLKVGMREFKKAQQTLLNWGYRKTVKRDIPADKYVFVKSNHRPHDGEWWVVVSFASGRWVAFDVDNNGATKIGNGMTEIELQGLKNKLN
jgi:hypothetical protein